MPNDTLSRFGDGINLTDCSVDVCYSSGYGNGYSYNYGDGYSVGDGIGCGYGYGDGYFEGNGYGYNEEDIIA